MSDLDHRDPKGMPEKTASEKAVPGKKKALRGVMIVFIAVCAAACLLPFVCMPFAQSAQTGEDDLAQMPRLFDADGYNTSYLSDLGDYFEDHFAGRSAVITWNSALRERLLHVSGVETVIIGDNDWLYYYETLDDYQGTDVLTDRAAENIAFNLSMMQDYVNAQGADFIVTFAPNKNSLYSENMPYYYKQGEENSLEKLTPLLAAYDVAYCDLYSVFAAQEEVLYYMRDTHWNTKGALLACRSLLTELGADLQLSALANLRERTVDDFTGDLEEMLYPSDPSGEMDYSYDESLSWSFVSEEADVEDTVVTTVSGVSEDGSLVMYRDSFANNMIPFLSTAYASAYYTKLTPYDLPLSVSYEADTVIIELAERNIEDIGEKGAIMPAKKAYPDTVREAGEAGVGNLACEKDGDYTVVTGDLPEDCRADADAIYIGIETTDGTLTWYEPFHITTEESDYGYKAYFLSAVEDAVRIYLAYGTDEEIFCSGSIPYELEE